MVKSMTGFGRCETEINGRAITVEIKSVNHRYFEFSCRVTRGYGFLEDKLKAFVNSRVARGKIDMFVSVGAADDVPCEVAVNHSLVSGYLTAMKEISDTYGIENDASVVSISRFPDVFTVSKAAVDEEQLTADVLSAAGQALDSFIAMREAEGERMKADILGRAQTILGIGAGASTKVLGGRRGIERLTECKYPYDYLARFDELMQEKEKQLRELLG